MEGTKLKIDDLWQDYEKLKAKIQIDRHDLDTEIVTQPDLYLQSGELHAEARALHDAHKHNVEVTLAECDDEIRRTSSPKPTETQIKNQAIAKSEYLTAYGEYLEAKLLAGKAAALEDSFKQRNYMLRELAQLYLGGYWMDKSITSSEEDAKTYKNEKAKQMARAKRDTFPKRKMTV